MRTRVLIALGLFTAISALYAQVVGHEFVDYDDFIYIVKNPNLPGGLTWQKFVNAFTVPYESNWIPLTWLSLQLDYLAFGEQPAGYLVENVVLHGLSTVLLFFALLRMTGALWCSAFVAAVFGLHPLHVESVAWAAERKDTLSGLFFMATLYAYVSYVDGGRSAVAYARLLLFFFLGLLAKPSALTLPFVLLLLDYWPLGRLRADGQAAGAIDVGLLLARLREKIPMFAIVVVMSAVTFSVQRSLGSMVFGDLLPFSMRLMNALESYLFYIRDSFWPTGLAVLYPHPGTSLSATQPTVAALLGIAVTVAVLRFSKTRPHLLVGWFWYVGMLVPVIGLVQVGLQARADRYMYFPLIGLAIMLAWGAREFAANESRRKAVAALGVASVLAMSTLSWAQIGYWRDTKTLFERALSVTERNYFAHTQVGDVFLRDGDLEQARAHYLAVAKIRPRGALPQFRLGEVYEKRGELDLASEHFEAGLRIEADNVLGLTGLGVVRMRQGRFQDALPNFQKALAEDPEEAQAHEGAGIVYERLGRIRDAVHHYREALRLEPERPTPANNLAWLLATSADEGLRDPAEALSLAEQSLANARDGTPGAKSPDPGVLDTLAAALAAAGRFDEALREARRAADLARAAGQEALAQVIENHVRDYESGRALRL